LHLLGAFAAQAEFWLRGNEAFVIIEGEIGFVEREITLKPGELFGEIALFRVYEGEVSLPTGADAAKIQSRSHLRKMRLLFHQREPSRFHNPFDAPFRSIAG
jgi:hypothetical protein